MCSCGSSVIQRDRRRAGSDRRRDLEEILWEVLELGAGCKDFRII